MAWFADNIGTILTAVLLLTVVALILRKMIRDRRQGKHSCGCGCEQCASRGMCGKDQPGK